MKRPFLVCLVIALTLTGCAAQAQGLAVRNGHVQARLIPEVQSIQNGQSFWAALSMTMDPGWHIYWKNSGDSGLPLKIQWHLPPGFQVHDLQWPTPEKIDQPPLTSYGYQGTVLLLSRIDPPADLGPGPHLIRAKVNWLVCAEQCIPGYATVEFELPASHQPAQIDPAFAKDFSQTRFRLPLEKSDWKIAAEDQKQNLTLYIDYPPQKYSLGPVYFFPERNDLINHALPQALKKTEAGYELSAPRSTLATQPIPQVKGVLYSPVGWRGPGSEQGLAIDIPASPRAAAVLPPSDPGQLPLMLLFAFLGGIILNLMPCVLPVLSLKILNFVYHSKSSKKQLWLHALVFTSGVLASFWVLDAILLVLRATGQQIGWGFQFQSPGFLIFLAGIFFVLALNLFGLFEIPGPLNLSPTAGRHSQWSNVFLSGALATLAATPCTAPFMGAALSFSLSQPPLVSFAIFTFLGLGMAFPYILLCLFPGLLRFVPKPGPWMEHFKKFLGVLLLATVVWLVWVLWGHVKIDPGAGATPQETSQQAGRIQWQPFSEELLAQMRQQNRIVFIDFTAKWCLTCQVNERLALGNPAVVKKFEKLNVAAIKADWTLQDAHIAKVLAGYGKNAIPLYVLYSKDPDAKPLILPEIITPKIVLEALEKAAKL